MLWDFSDEMVLLDLPNVSSRHITNHKNQRHNTYRVHIIVIRRERVNKDDKQ